MLQEQLEKDICRTLIEQVYTDMNLAACFFFCKSLTVNDRAAAQKRKTHQCCGKTAHLRMYMTLNFENFTKNDEDLNQHKQSEKLKHTYNA